ncbi:MAG: hypothetical protein JWR69_4432 [Pedosphaera sp.]|nr:hypothetical protein [Pedosphaera sp.]
MKISFLILVLTIATVGCRTTSPNSGAPPSGYETGSGQGESPATVLPSPGTDYPGPGWQRWDYHGLGSST